MEVSKRGMHVFLGVTLFTQAVTSLAAGCIFLNPFSFQTIDDSFLRMVAGSAGAGIASILLHIVTAVVIVMLGVAMYRLAGCLNKPTADIALAMYVLEAALLLVSQAFVFGLMQTARLYAISGDAALIPMADILYSCKKFSAEIAMIPFGVGAVPFYYLITKAGVIPRWLGWYGMATAPLVLVCVPLGAFGVAVPFAFLAPYVPFEFFAGAYILFRARKIAA